MSEDARTRIAALIAKASSTSTTLPRTTLGTSEEYLEKTASVVSHAMLPNPLWRLWFPVPDGNADADVDNEKSRLRVYHDTVKRFVGSGITRGGFVIQAEDFAACASWWPPGSHQEPPPPPPEAVTEGDRQMVSVSEAFARETAKIFREHVWDRYGQRFWCLVILARDPERTNPVVPGAVRAVLQPCMDLAVADGLPIWLVTSSAHARDIYLHLGWRVVGTITLYGHSEWCMLLSGSDKEENRLS